MSEMIYGAKIKIIVDSGKDLNTKVSLNTKVLSTRKFSTRKGRKETKNINTNYRESLSLKKRSKNICK